MTATIKPAGRTLVEFQLLKPAEQKLLEACRQGTVAHISDKRPEAANGDNTVRAAFLRFLALGGDEFAPVHEHGVQLAGAWIENKLDMEAAKVPSTLAMFACHFNTIPVFRGAKIAGALNLDTCQLPGFAGDMLVCDGALFLRQGFAATGEVRLLGAHIGGSLECCGAKFDGINGDALSADGAVIKGGVFLNQGFTASGVVRLLHAQIGGNLECSGAKFDGKDGDAMRVDRAVIKGSVLLNQSTDKQGKEINFTAMGEVRLRGTQIGGNLDCDGAQFDGKNSYALSTDGMVVEGTFFFRKLVSPVNGVSLAASHVGCLVDDTESWGEGLVLDGFVYDSITGGAPTDATTRLAWLDRQSKLHVGLSGGGASFMPQPWRQLAKVLREMGYAEDARQVAIAFEHRLRKANLVRYPLMHWLFGVFTGYGYRPMRLLLCMFGVWLFCGILYWYAALAGVFVPSSPAVLQNQEYAVCKPDYVAPAPQSKVVSTVPPTIQGAGNWYLCGKLYETYPGFSPLAYSLDVLLPPVDLQQKKNWAPLIQAPKGAWCQESAIFYLKHLTRLVLWFEILFGWVSSLLLVAVASGLTKRREE